MTDPYLTIVSDGGSLASNEQASSGVGVEVVAGMTGLGLPPVDLQFDSGAGDGARYRGKRVLQRSLDLTFNIFGPNRNSLRSTLDRLTMILAHPCTITWHDPDAGEEWTIKAYRSGGGDYSYGEDTNGNTEVSLSVSMQTESPYWDSVTTVTASRSGSGTLTLNNVGTVGGAPVWTVPGPTLGFTATSPTGEVLRYNGLIDKGRTVTIDTEQGTVRDDQGNNLYPQLDSLPRFFQIAPGQKNYTVTVDAASADYQTAYALQRKNFVTNPHFSTDTVGWTLVGYQRANNRVEQISSLNARPNISTNCSGLTIGKTYVVRFSADQTTMPAVGEAAKWFPAKVVVLDNGVEKSSGWTKQGSEYVFTFVADSTDVTLTIYPKVAQGRNGKWRSGQGWIDAVFLGDPGPFFTGGTTDTPDWNYEWVGTVNQSVSTATPVFTPSTPPTVSVAFKPRKWVMI